ncbi:MAG: immunoglobulin domain-containing protein [Burkholderiaceae bacterium]
MMVVQPAVVSVPAGAPATFSVTATGGAPLSYQWKRDGVPIAGASTATYTLAAAASRDNGASFAADVGNPAGILSSAAATLSVTAIAASSAATLGYSPSDNLDGRRVTWSFPAPPGPGPLPT